MMSNQKSCARSGCHSGPSPKNALAVIEGRGVHTAIPLVAVSYASTILRARWQSRPRRGPEHRAPFRSRNRPHPPRSIHRNYLHLRRRRHRPACPGAAPRASPSTRLGPARLAGNSFRPSAPALSAANASVGVKTPGKDCNPSRLVSAMTSASKLGETIRRPPASATARTSSTAVTVPAPIKACRRSPVPWPECSQAGLASSAVPRSGLSPHRSAPRRPNVPPAASDRAELR
jgi:hypothetical protein